MDKPTDWRSGTRRIFSNEFKLHMVELASKPNANVAQLAREHGVDNNLIFKWLRLWQREGRISRRMPPTIVDPTVPQSFPASPNFSTPHAVLQLILLRRHYQLLVRLPAMWNSITVT
ncbi:transposase [Escherichia coli]|nr:transposase [Escherichia coli]